MVGKVVSFGSKGYGFIRADGVEHEIFVHVRDCVGRKNLTIGRTVTFKLKEGRGERQIAYDVQEVSE